MIANFLPRSAPAPAFAGNSSRGSRWPRPGRVPGAPCPAASARTDPPDPAAGIGGPEPSGKGQGCSGRLIPGFPLCLFSSFCASPLFRNLSEFSFLLLFRNFLRIRWMNVHYPREKSRLELGLLYGHFLLNREKISMQYLCYYAVITGELRIYLSSTKHMEIVFGHSV